MAQPDIVTPESVERVCEQSSEKLQLVADLLLLNGDGGTHFSAANLKPILKPIGQYADYEPYGKLRDTIVADTKSLAISAKGLGQQMSQWNLNKVHKIAVKVTNQAIILTEAAAHAAYHASLADIHCTPAMPGVIDHYSFERAKQELHLSCENFKSKYFTGSTGENILSISKTFAENIELLSRGCILASENKDVSPIDRAQFFKCSQSLQSSTATFLNTLKAFASLHSEENRQRCLLFSKPLLSTVDSIIEFSSFPQFSGQQAILTNAGHKSQINILGAAMAIVSSTTQLLGTVKAILNENEREKKVRTLNWQKLSKCTKAVGDATNLLSSNVREHTPVPSRRPSTT